MQNIYKVLYGIQYRLRWRLNGMAPVKYVAGQASSIYQYKHIGRTQRDGPYQKVGSSELRLTS